MTEVYTPLAKSPDGDTVMSVYTSNKVTWFFLRSYIETDGGGEFFSFQTLDKSGAGYDAVLLNGGLVNATPGQINSDLDIMLYVDSRACVIAFTGKYQQQPAGILPWPPNIFSLGSATNWWSGLYLQEYPATEKMKALPGNPQGYVKVNDKAVLLYPIS